MESDGEKGEMRRKESGKQGGEKKRGRKGCAFSSMLNEILRYVLLDCSIPYMQSSVLIKTGNSLGTRLHVNTAGHIHPRYVHNKLKLPTST